MQSNDLTQVSVEMLLLMTVEVYTLYCMQLIRHMRHIVLAHAYMALAQIDKTGRLNIEDTISLFIRTLHRVTVLAEVPQLSKRHIFRLRVTDTEQPP